MNTEATDGETAVHRILRHSRIDVEEFLGNLPPHLRSLSHQAAGHLFSQEQKTLGILEDTRNGILLKPIDAQSIYELRFYEEVKTGNHSNLAKLIPDFHGTVSLPYKDETVEFMALENLGHGLKKPCVMDLKIGEITWGPEATTEKINSDKSKYRVKELYGFAMPGCRFINPITDEERQFDRKECRSLNPKSLVEAMESFVHTTGNNQVTAALVKCILRKLQPIIEWTSTQTDLRLISSSIIILYDAQALLHLLTAIKERPDTETDCEIAQVKMVDFAHVYKASEDDPGIDRNYLKGVESVMEVFQNILKKYSHSE